MPDVLNGAAPVATEDKLTGRQRSEEIAYIIEHMPTRFGILVTGIVALLFALLLIFGYLIKYPDVLHGQINISTNQAPVKLVAASSGRLQLLVQDSTQAVQANQYLAVMHNAADYRDVQKLNKLLHQLSLHQLSYGQHRHLFPENLTVGELNSSYFSFLGALYQYLDYYHVHPYDKQKEILDKQLVTQNGVIEQTGLQYAREKQRFELSQGLYRRDSSLYAGKVIAAGDLEKAKMDMINNEQQFKTLDKEIISEKYQAEEICNKLQQLAIQQLDKEHELEINLFNAYYGLLDNIREWEHKYVFIAPIGGKAELSGFWKTDDFIDAGREVFTVIPKENNLVGQVIIPEQGAGKIRTGQDVIIKLDDYPFGQYGSVKGKVKQMSLVTNKQAGPNNQVFNNYLVVVSLPEGLKTNYGSTLDFRFEAKGTAEIITDKRRLIERMFDNLRHRTH